MKVLNHIAGSHVVVQFRGDHYLDARKDVRYPGFSFIEMVRNGQVYHRENATGDKAPARIIELCKGVLT